jgi:DnaJ-class molecular chaperone
MTLDESYRELGLAPGCTDADLKEAWRRLAARWHPDRNASPQALRKIQRINRALEEIRRARSDGTTAMAQPEPAPPQDARAPEHVIDHTITITLEEACSGCTRELHGELVEDCAQCAASGLQARSSECAACGGSGRNRPHLWFSWLAGSTPCKACDGIGVRRAACAACEGSGKARPRRYRCRVDVPAGTRAGGLLHVSARVQGRQQCHQLALRVRVELQPHALFAVEADGTVKCEVPVDGFAWMAERWIEVPTPRGLHQMRLRRGFLTYRVKGHGLPQDEAGAAAPDCIVTVVPLFPEECNAEQQLLVDRLVASNTGAGGTAAGNRMAAWRRAVTDWEAQQRRPSR